MIESKIALAAASSTILLAIGSPDTGEISEIVKLGLAGLAMGIVFRMATHTIPELVKANSATLLDISKLNAEATKEAAKINAEANGKSAAVHADAIANLGRVISDSTNRTSDMMADMITKAIHMPPPNL